MGLLKLIPKSLQLRVLLKLLVQAREELEAEHLGQQLNKYMDERLGSDVSNPVQAQMALWLQQVAKELVT